MPVLSHKILRDLTRRRVRAALTLVGIVVGVAGLVAVSATARQLGVAQRSLTTAADHPDLIVRTVPLAPRIASLVARQPGFAQVASRTVLDADFSAGGAWRSCVLIGLSDPAGPALSQPALVAGRLPGRGEIAFDAGVSELAPVHLGDLVAVRQADGNALTYFTVVGFTRTPAAIAAGILNSVNAYATSPEVRAISGQTGANELLAKLTPGTDSHDAANRLARLLDQRGIGHGAVIGPDSTLVGAKELQTLVWLLFAFSLLGLVLSGFLVANTAAAVVQDEFNQIGILKALGSSRRRVAAVYVAPAAVLGWAGTVLGYGAGLFGGQAIVRYLTGLLGYPRPPLAITARELGLALLVGVGMPVLASLLPALLGARLSVAALLRSYGITAAAGTRRQGFLPRLIGRRWPVTAMGLRNALRRRLRAGITMMLIAIAVAAAIASQGLSSSLQSTVATLYGRYGADAWIPFDVSATDALAASVGRAPGVVAAEPWVRATGYADGRSVDLWGVPATTQIYHERLIAGRWLATGDERSAVASGSLARRLHLAVGDQLALDIGRQTRDITVVGIVDDESTYLGSTDAGKLFFTPAALTAINPGQVFSFLAVVFTRHDPQDVEATLATLRGQFASLHPEPYAAYSDKASTERTIDVLVVLLRAMVVLVALTGLIGVVNTLSMNVAERRREVGVVRALGAGRRHIATLLLGEGLVLGAYGYLLGLGLGLPLAYVLVRETGNVLFRLSFSLPLPFLGLVLAVTLLACAVASVGPALIAARVRPSTVLRYE